MRRPSRIAGPLLLALVAGLLPASVVLAGEPSSVALTGPSTIEVGQDALLTATITAPDGYDAEGATVDFIEAGGATGCTGVPVDASGTTCVVPGLAVGAYTYHATYSGNSTVDGSTSTVDLVLEVTALPDTTLDASGVTRNYTKFYPVRDGYRDKVTMSGLRNEPITVTIRIYASTGKRVKRQVVALGSGPYSYAWSGRNSAGTILASGKYKIVQTLTDAAGNRQVVTQYTTLSKKRLVTKTKYVTKLGKSISAQSSAVLVSRSGYLKLDARSVVKNVGYQFTLPSAIRYKSLSFQIYAKGPKTSPASAIGMQNFSWCPYVAHEPWDISCFDRVKTTGGSGTKWYSTSGSVTANHSGTRARGVVSAADGIYYVYKARVKVVYQVLQ